MFGPMQGVTTALVAFIFFCVIFPERIKNRPQFYAAFGLICLIIVLDALSFMIGAAGFRVFAYFGVAILQVGTICLLFLAAGGITWRDLGGELSNAFEVIRRGGEEKEVIVPLRGEVPRRKDEEVPSERVNLDEPAPTPRTDEQRRGGADASIPLE